MAKSKSASSVMFKVNRLSPEFVVPAKPTPYEFKSLSDLDIILSIPSFLLYFYPNNPSMDGVDLVQLIKNAISQALVYYYPFAGRIREDPSGKLMVECTGEGVLFVEADADVTLDQLGYPLVPHFTFHDQLIFGVSESSDILNSVPLVIQMTRLKCRGLVVGVRVNHSMCDGAGFIQFMSAISEMAKGATSLSVLPTWERHIFSSSSPHQGRFSNFQNTNNYAFDPKDLCYRTFFLGKTETSALRRYIARSFQRCSFFEILMSCVWKCRVSALASHSTDEEIVSLNWPIDLRKQSNHIKVPPGYYGNALIYAVVKSSEKKIIENPLAYTLQLVTNGKEIVTKGMYRFVLCLGASMKNFTMSDIRYAGLDQVEFGWGKPAYGGLARCPPNIGIPFPFTHKNGEKGLMVPMCLPN